MAAAVSRAGIQAASERIRGFVRHTPVVDLGTVIDPGYRLSLKLDTMQPTGTFKVRGAFSLLTGGEVPERGVVAASGGNFASRSPTPPRSSGTRQRRSCLRPRPRRRSGASPGTEQRSG